MSNASNTDAFPLRETLLNLLDGNTDLYPHAVEKEFPHVLQRIIGFWGKVEMAKYFGNLLAPPQPGKQGFPEQVREEILALKSACQAKGILPPETKESVNSNPLATNSHGHHDHHEHVSAIFERLGRH